MHIRRNKKSLQEAGPRLAPWQKLARPRQNCTTEHWHAPMHLHPRIYARTHLHTHLRTHTFTHACTHTIKNSTRILPGARTPSGAPYTSIFCASASPLIHPGDKLKARTKNWLGEGGRRLQADWLWSQQFRLHFHFFLFQPKTILTPTLCRPEYEFAPLLTALFSF